MIDYGYITAEPILYNIAVQRCLLLVLWIVSHYGRIIQP